jgi:hypothetical protein
VGTARRRGSDVSRGGTIGIRRFVIDDEDCETLCESYVTHTRVCEKKPKSARQRAKSRQKRHQRDCPTVLFLTRVHEFHSYTNAPSRTAAKLTRRGDSIFQGLRPTKNHTENAIFEDTLKMVRVVGLAFAPQIGNGIMIICPMDSRKVVEWKFSRFPNPESAIHFSPAFLTSRRQPPSNDSVRKTSIIRRPWKGAPGTARDPCRVPERLGRLTEATLRAHSAARARSPSIDAGGGARKAP